MIIVVRKKDVKLAMIADGGLGIQTVVSKPLGPEIQAREGISGCAILGDGKTSLILEVASLHQLLGLEQGSLVLDALASGAVDYFPKPAHADMAKEASALLEKLEVACRVGLLRRTAVTPAMSGAAVRSARAKAADRELRGVNVTAALLTVIGKDGADSLA